MTFILNGRDWITVKNFNYHLYEFRLNGAPKMILDMMRRTLSSLILGVDCLLFALIFQIKLIFKSMMMALELNILLLTLISINAINLRTIFVKQIWWMIFFSILLFNYCLTMNTLILLNITKSLPLKHNIFMHNCFQHQWI